MHKILTTVALTLVASAFTTFAQETPAPAAPSPAAPSPAQPNPSGKAKPERRGMRMPLIAALDANHDGVIDAQEIANAPAALKTLDKNGDGQLTRDELRPARPEGQPPRAEGRAKERRGGRPGGDGAEKRPHNPLIEALDANRDGVIDAQEIANAPAALKTLDKNGDGQLTRDEIKPVRPDGDQDPGTKNAEHPKRGHKQNPAATATPAAPTATP
ncbi:MAG: hypothetical protein PHQ12_08580 [Chthoniobacteraceae bacterium]|nr:hypothetical protein [Chthoniobacteraceae bacterium]